MIYIYIFVALVVAYLFGSIPNAVWIGRRFYGVDVREHGSCNAGATNTLRVLGRKAGLVVFLLDMLKGFVAVTIMGLLPVISGIDVDADLGVILKIIAVFATVLGHIFPIFAGFRGGKGVATLVGSVVAIYPLLIFICFVAWFILLAITHYVSLSSMVAGCLFAVLAPFMPQSRGSVPMIIFAFVVAVLLIWTHRKNIERLKSGTESKIYLKRPKGE